MIKKIVAGVLIVGGVGYWFFVKQDSLETSKDTKTSSSSENTLTSKVVTTTKATASNKVTQVVNLKPVSVASVYTNTVHGFSFVEPIGWKEDTTGQFGTTVLVYNPQATSTKEGMFTTTINVTVSDPGALSLDEYTQATVAALKKAYPDYKEMVSTKTEIGGVSARVIGGAFTNGSFKVRNVQLIVIKDAKVITMTSTALQSEWSIYADVFSKAFASFVVTK